MDKFLVERLKLVLSEVFVEAHCCSLKFTTSRWYPLVLPLILSSFIPYLKPWFRVKIKLFQTNLKCFSVLFERATTSEIK